jgi:hypothetical protein
MVRGVVTHLPALAGPGFRPFGDGAIRTAMGQIQATVTSGLRQATSGGIGAGWGGQVEPQGRTVALGVTNAHPGARPLDQGATWPGPMPPAEALAGWAAARGLSAFAVAKSLKTHGLAPRHFVARTVDALHGTILDTLMDTGVRRWVLPQGG